MGQDTGRASLWCPSPEVSKTSELWGLVVGSVRVAQGPLRSGFHAAMCSPGDRLQVDVLTLRAWPRRLFERAHAMLVGASAGTIGAKKTGSIDASNAPGGLA